MPSLQTPSDEPRVPTQHPTAARKLIVPIALFVIVGVPLVAVIWDTLNRLFAGHVEWNWLGASVVAAGLLWVLLKVLARTVTRWEARRFD